MTPDELLKVINENCKVKVDEVPPGWFTIKQLCKQTNETQRSITKKVRSAFDAGKLERKEFRIDLGSGIIRPCPHYRKKG